jgi:hypothetical protein
MVDQLPVGLAAACRYQRLSLERLHAAAAASAHARFVRQAGQMVCQLPIGLPVIGVVGLDSSPDELAAVVSLDQACVFQAHGRAATHLTTRSARSLRRATLLLACVCLCCAVVAVLAQRVHTSSARAHSSSWAPVPSAPREQADSVKTSAGKLTTLVVEALRHSSTPGQIQDLEYFLQINLLALRWLNIEAGRFVGFLRSNGVQASLGAAPSRWHAELLWGEL